LVEQRQAIEMQNLMQSLQVLDTVCLSLCSEFLVINIVTVVVRDVGCAAEALFLDVHSKITNIFLLEGIIDGIKMIKLLQFQTGSYDTVLAKF